MITISEALVLILEHAAATSATTELTSGARGRVLARDVMCSLDSPPHDKSQVDGYAVRSSDFADAPVELRVLEEVTAGQVPTKAIQPGSATRIMTGAPVPEIADAVVMIELCEVLSTQSGAETVRVISPKVQAGQNIMRRGESMKAGDIVLRTGHRLRGLEIGLLAELGVERVELFAEPQVAVLATGNELVPFVEQPGPGQIRNSNGPMTQALVAESFGKPFDLGIARDNLTDLESKIRQGLAMDAFILSGGVSAGVLDLVPDVLKRLGAREVFHKVQLKPGKPIWFGIAPRDEKPPCLVFGLPGNPVSALVCFHLFVRPALAKMSGDRSSVTIELTGELAREFSHRGDRPTFHPGRASTSDGVLIVEPLAWRGSSDLRTLADANALIHFPAGSKTFAAHSPVRLRML